MLMIVANGNGGQVNPGDSIFMDNNNSYQGGLYGVNAVEFGNNDSVDGPIVGSQIILANNLVTNSFPDHQRGSFGDAVERERLRPAESAPGLHRLEGVLAGAKFGRLARR